MFRIEEKTDKLEKKLGKVFGELYQNNEINDSLVTHTIDSIVTRICEANNINRSELKIHVVKQDDVNAFALPGGHLVVYSGLIRGTANAEALSGVLSHEIAHIQLDHVMKKLVKEVGLSVLISMGGGKGGETVAETARMLSSSAFDRKLEKQADLQAVDYMQQAAINPEPFAQFLYTISDKDAPGYFTWISTHPESKERAEYILEYREKKGAYKTVLDSASWNQLQRHCQTDAIADEQEVVSDITDSLRNKREE
jgi:predicted Zn-dependent protease